MTEPVFLPVPRLLVIMPNWIGDAIMAQPLLALLKRRYPDHAIDVLASAWIAPVLYSMAEVDTVLESTFKRGTFSLRQYWRYAQILRQKRYEQAYVLPNTIKLALLPWFAGIKTRIGYKGENRYGLINVMHHDNRQAPRAMVPFYAALASAPSRVAPAAVHRPVLQMPRAQVDMVMGMHRLSAQHTVVTFAPGAEFGGAKRWPAVHFADLAHQILQSDPSTQILLLGSPADTKVCDIIKILCPEVHQLAGKTSLDQAIALIAATNAMVSNDSGLLHMASALNRPVIALYGPTDPHHAPPFSDIAKSIFLNLSCAPCRQRECPLGHQNCMQKISSDQVWQSLEPMLKKAPKMPVFKNMS